MAETTETPDRRKRRLAITKFGLAGVAVLGVGAAITAAAWTDEVWFSGSASASNFDLQASLTSGAGYVDVGVDATDDSSADDDVLVIPAETFDGITPGFDESVTVYLYNAGDVPISLAEAVVDSSGDLFTGADQPTVEVTDLTGVTLQPETEMSFDVQITTPGDWAETHIGESGSLSVQIVGSAV